ncbi:MAG TPA: hydrogenase expression/formation protein HypE [Caldisericia bacterium]|nr:hydrogenase expression/formation protein HypE [Caldisericia bacterium]HPF48691.1 hydrogenase expression/formation protein HypE [Caldisericia bacterium]HPI83649.1 hydrogenase expression/formation protein HypE [Caldisericia bacterium]HPQ93146.1 hydrogenase expression/formation protein HypE [Caldisericia bacterium]HRV75021.1 hydrogenase expression/formation protein HypE [Caldisericia bacterium]
MAIGKVITLSHGGGGIDSRELVEMISEMLKNPLLSPLEDSSIIGVGGGKIAYTTDGFVVKPPFFPGGDIGKLCVCGTVNDLAVMGAKPIALSLSMIIEEGFEIEKLKTIIKSIKDTAGGIPIATGDTKVVEKGSVDGIFVTTSGIGLQHDSTNPSASSILPGDVFVATGSIGRHGAAIMAAREDLGFAGDLVSDVARLDEPLLTAFSEFGNSIRTCRDITRGGLSAIVSEFAISSNVGVELYEDDIPIDSDVSGICSALGIDPLNLACEGSALMAVSPDVVGDVIATLQKFDLTNRARMIGKATSDHGGKTYLKTSIGGKRILEPPIGELLPRIC